MVRLRDATLRIYSLWFCRERKPVGGRSPPTDGANVSFRV